MAASYPNSVKTFQVFVDDDVVQPSCVNDPDAEITAIEGGLLNGFAHHLRPDATANHRNLGLTTAKFYDLNLSNAATIDGNTVLGGTLALTGAATLSSTLGVVGNLAVNTNKFTVAASSGNTAVAGTLAVTGVTTLGTANITTLAVAGTLSAAATTLTTVTDPVLTVNYSGASGSNSQIAFYRGATLQGSISTTGGTTSYNTSSDEKLKMNIRPTGSVLERVLAMPVVEYQFIADEQGMTHTGFLAEQIEPLCPHAVTAPTEGVPFWQMDYSRMVPLLVRSVQELTERVIQLEAKKG